MTPQFDVFISYASEDGPIAACLERHLQRENFRVWRDTTRLSVGCKWDEEIERALQASRIVLPILTPRWRASEWTRFETYGADSVIPLLTEGDWEEVAPPPLKRWQRLRVDHAPTAEQIATLSTAIRNLLAKQPPVKDDTGRKCRFAPAGTSSDGSAN